MDPSATIPDDSAPTIGDESNAGLAGSDTSYILNAAKGGGLIFQSDHSVPSNISAENYEYVVNLVREYGQYPLELGEYDIPELS